MMSRKALRTQCRIERNRLRRRPLRLDSLEDRSVPANFAYITEFDPWGTTSNDAAMDTVFGAGSWDKFTFSDAVANGVFTPGQYQFLFFDGSDANGSIYESFLDANRTTLEGWTFAGGNVVLNAGRNTATSQTMNVAFGATLTQNFNGGQASASAVDLAHPIFVGPQTPIGTAWNGDFFAHDYVTGPGLTSLIVNGDGNSVLQELDWGGGKALIGGMTATDFHNPQPEAFNLRANILYHTMYHGLVVSSTDPASGSVVFSTPTQYIVNVSDPLDEGTIQAGDFQVNGIAATDYTYTPGSESITFTFAADPVSGEGLQTMHVGVDAFIRTSDLDGVAEFDGSFRYDLLQLQVTSTNPADGSVVLLPFTTLDLNFNEDYAFASAQPSDFVVNQGTVAAVSQVDSDTLRLTLSGVVAEGTLTVNMAAGAMTDEYGNPGAAYSGNYALDFGTFPYPTPLLAKNPSGSLIYGGAQAGFVDPATDSDTFSILVDPGQKITLTVDPADTLQPIVELYRGDELIGSATAGSAGLEAVLQSVAGHGQLGVMGSGPKTYLVTVRGAGGTTGAYSVQMTLNAAVENGSHDGTANNTPATAQSLEPAFLPFNASVTASPSAAYPGRAAVLGRHDEFATATVYSADFESGAQGFTVGNDPADAPDPTFGVPYLPGLWHLSTGRGDQSGHSANTSFYYGGGEGPDGGGSINIGVSSFSPNPTFGTITSPSVALPTGGTLMLDFNYVLETRGFPDFVDFADLQIDSGSGWTSLKRFDRVAESSSWVTSDPIDLTAYAGQTVQLRWSFDTVLGPVGRSPEGWYVDDVRIRQFVPVGDYYSFGLRAGESATLALTGLSPGNLSVTLENAAGTSLATGNAGPSNVDRIISDFVATTTGTYYARVVGTNIDGTDYSLVVSRNSAFDTENNDTLATAQGLVSTQVAGRAWALGALTAGRTITLDFVDSGWWNTFGDHNAGNDNYFVGQSLDEYRNFFVFDLAGVNGLVIDAQLRLTNPFGGYSSPDSTETYSLFDVSTPVSSLSASGSGETAIFDDLGTGTTLGSQTVSFADDGQIVTVSLGQAGLSLLNAAVGGPFALGGALTTLSGGNDQYLFGASGQNNHVRQLVLTLADTADFYRVTADALKTLEVQTLTPASKNGEVVNALDPMVRIYNASGVLVASDDNSLPDGRNAKVSYKVPKGAGGTYYIEVIPSTATTPSTQGEYILSVKGSSTLPPGSPLLAASTPTGKAAKGNLTAAGARPLLQEALRRWKLAGIDTSVLGKLNIRVLDLGGRTLGFASGNTIYLDNNAAGWGWFVDKTVRSDAEFSKIGNQGEQGRIDLLSVLMHEVGHLLGQMHSVDGIMFDTLGTGTRRKPGSVTL